MAADGRTIERFVAGVWQPLRPGAEVYLVDPLDGTLIWQIGGGFAVMIALGRVVDGRDGPAVEWFGAVVCLPKSREVMFGLVGGGGLWLDYGNCRVSPLRASREACLRHAKVATHLSSQEKNRPLVERFIAHQLTPLARAAERILMQGCQGAQMAAVATGQYDAFISVQSGGPWDYLPPALLLGVAGGLVRSFVNAPLGLRDLGVVAAGSADLYLNLRALLDLGLYAPADFPPPPVP
jgi:3'-phosphoadenosine 5'-phosphosulfate (PAPS) 3'-phosphatase